MTVTPRRRMPRDRAQLHRTAGELGPEVLPFYIAAPTRPGQAAGWYWKPRGADAPQFLGSNVFMAEAMLLSLLTTA